LGIKCISCPTDTSEPKYSEINLKEILYTLSST
jgi:hypothetical protein